MKADLSGATVPLDLVERVMNERQDLAHSLIAYYIMSVNLACSVHHPDLLGYQRAGRSLGKSLSTTKRAWARFSPVVHLQVAPSFHPHDGKQPPQDWLVQMLSYAEEIRRRGEGIYPHGREARGMPLLDPAKTWKCPPDLALPSVELQVEPLSDDLLRKLRAVGR